MLFKQVLIRWYNLLVLVLFTVFVYGQDVEIKEHPLYQSVVPTINNNQPDSFEIKMAQYFGNPEDSAAARGLIELALDLGIRTESKRWELEACHELSVFYSKNGDKQTALRYARKAESLLPYGTLHHQLRNNNLQGI